MKFLTKDEVRQVVLETLFELGDKNIECRTITVFLGEQEEEHIGLGCSITHPKGHPVEKKYYYINIKKD